MHGHTEHSLKPRLYVTLGHVLIVVAAFWILLGGGLELVASWVGAAWTPGDLSRRILIGAFAAVYLARATFGMFVLLKRKFAVSEALIVLGLFCGFQLTFALLGGQNTAPLGWMDGVAIALYTLGSYFNTGSEYARYVWKKNPDNKGKLYTEGLFRYSMHINYFGDTLLFTGFAILTGSPWAFLVPALMTLGFLFQHIPTLDAYLAKRYAGQFEEYARKTPKFMPFVY